ncbi:MULTISPECIES: DUF3226 domain-containing protein [Spirulina sp. CCY15215]|uniref:DUF3226 domain-containing protein n=1 Tax=Spirulina sp. CCY15215 TaxID=2767591 RepID=UPI001950FEB9
MSKKYALIGVEGNHDQAFVEKILRKLLGFNRFNGKVSELDPFWRKFIPVYPKNGKLYARLDMPSILVKDELSVAIYAGEGSKLVTNLKDKLSNIDRDRISAFAIIADADRKSPIDIARNYQKGLQEYFPNFPDRPGTISRETPRSGIYILPDNSKEGVLETLLRRCGEIAYPTYLEQAENYLNSFSEAEIKKLKWKPFDHEKSLIATVVSILKPGKTNTTSISDNHWVSEKTYAAITELQELVDFLTTLLGIEANIKSG